MVEPATTEPVKVPTSTLVFNPEQAEADATSEPGHQAMHPCLHAAAHDLTHVNDQ